MNGRAWAKLAAGMGAAVAGREFLRRQRRFDFDGAVVLITGGSRGLGLALAHEFAGQGARLAICARDEAELEWARDELQATGSDVLALPCDVGDREQVRRLIDTTTARYGNIDVLVNNAGTITVGPLHHQRIEDYELALATMYWGVIYPTLAVLPGMLERGDGRIINITSIGGRMSVPHLLPYSGAKFAAVGFSEGLRAELSGSGVYVTTVVPGLMRTGSFVNAKFKGQHEEEYTWFALSSSLPGISMDAGAAARQIVRAAQQGDADVILGIPAQLAARAHGLAPGLTSEMLGIVNRLLPEPATGNGHARPGYSSETDVTRSFVTDLGHNAAHEYHQYPADAPHPPQSQTRPH